MKIITNIAVLFLLSYCSPLRADTFNMKDKSTVKGNILSFYEDKFVISLESGGKQVVERGSIDNITFESAQPKADSKMSEKNDTSASLKASPDFASPIKTFIFWKKAAEKGELEKMADSFITPSREDQLVELKNFSKEKIKETSKEVKKTDFSFSDPLYDGDKAYLSVTRKRGGSQKTEIVQFQKEGENWKMLPD
jgi:hypothetical protein